MPTLPAHHTGASVSSPTFDCTSCGACCFGGHDRYVALLPEDRGRAIPASATHDVDGRRFLAMTCGHCAQLTLTAAGETLCAIYDHRPEACRAFRAGSFECIKARQRRGPEAMALRAAVMAGAAAATAAAPPGNLPEVPPLVPPPEGAQPAQSLPPG